MPNDTQTTEPRQADQSTPAYQPGDLDRLLFAVHEACDISTRGIIRKSGVPWVRGKAALVELERRGLARRDSGHHHGDADLCFCKAGEVAGLPKLTHWYDVERKADAREREAARP
jgi:hypothetical protein